jgi:hypothetical protein
LTLTGNFRRVGHLINEELETLLESVDYEEFGEAYLSHSRQDSTVLKLVFDIKSGTDAIEDSTWAIRADHVYAYNIWNEVKAISSLAFRYADTALEFSSDHPIIDACAQPNARLSIRGKAANLGQLLLEIARMHEYQFSPYLDNLVASPQAIDVLMAGYGIVGSGPESVLNQYTEILKAHGVQCRLISSNSEKKAPAVALLMERGFVVSQFMWAEQLL